MILVAITSVLSLLYAVQYYVGGPIRLSVVSELYDIALSPDATLVAAGARDGRVHVWEVDETIRTSVPSDFNVSKELPWPEHRLVGHREGVIEIGFAPDGTELLSIDRAGVVKRWSLADMQEIGTLNTDANHLLDAALAANDEMLVTVERSGAVDIWDLDTQQPIQSFDPSGKDALAVALNQDGSLMAVGAGPNIEVYDVQSGDLVQSLEGYWDDPEDQDDWLGHDEDVTALAFSPDGQYVASGSADTSIVFWELETGEAAWVAEGHWSTVTTMVFRDDATSLLSGGEDDKIRNLRVPGGKSTASYEGHLSVVNGAVYGPTPETIFSAGGDGSLRVWETANQKLVHIEWSRLGFQPAWGRLLAAWMLLSGLVGLVCFWGLRKMFTWSHLLTLTLYLLGPIVVLGLPLFEVLSYPVLTGVKIRIALPLIALLVWYVALLSLVLREPVATRYQAPQDASLSEQIMVSQRTLRTRFGIFSIAVWIGLLVILFSVLRRFNLDIAFMGHFLSFIMGGAGLTVVVSIASIVLAVVLALLGALGRLSKNPIANGVSGFYISLIRGTPLLVQIFIWYLGLPRLNIILKPLTAGILALGVNYGAYMTEIFRAGIQAIGKGQYEAAQALGMSGAQTFRRIVLPQAFRIVIPPIGNQFIAMMKDSSLVYLMGVWELTFRAQKIGRQNFRSMETFLIAAAFYWVLTVAFQFLQGKLEEYMARSERR